MIEGFVHRPGFHCGSTALRLMLRFYGHKVSEAFCLGMGQGLGTTYMPLPDNYPSRLVMVRNGFLEMDALANFGIPATMHQTNDAQEAWEWVRDLLDRGEPAMIQVDVKDLPYYNTNTRFAGHKVIVCGYDPAEGTVEISDNEFEQVQTISMKQLEKARISPQFPFNLRHNFFEIDMPKNLKPFERAVPRALRGQASVILNKEGLFGIAAMERLSEEVVGWGKLSDWSWCCRFAYQAIEKRGTGGGAFRSKYAEFLHEAAPYCLEIQRLDLPAQMEEIGELWKELGNRFKYASEQETPNALGAIGEIADQIAKQERAFFKKIREAIPQ